MKTKKVGYPDGTYVCLKLRGDEGIRTVTGFTKDDNGIIFSLEQARLVGEGDLHDKEVERFTREAVSFVSLEKI